MLEHLAILLLAAHLLAVNLASVGPVVCAWLDWREGRGDTIAGQAGRTLAWWSILALALGMLGGLAVGLALWDDAYRLALRRLSSKIYFGGAELAFSLTLMLIHLWCWQRGWGNSRRGRIGRGCLALLASTNLLYHFPLLLVIFARMVSGFDEGELPLTSADFRQRIVNSVVIARSLHFWLASVAVTGAALMAVAVRKIRTNGSGAMNGTDVADVADVADDLRWRAMAAWGARIALVPSLLQVASGGWLLIQLEPVVQTQLLGGDVAASLVFASGVAAALWLMHRLASAAWGDISRRSIHVTLAALALVVLLMTGTLRHLERSSRAARPAVELPANSTSSGASPTDERPAV